MTVRFLLAGLAALMIAACGSDGPSDELPDASLDVVVVADGFDGPTQITFTPEGDLLVAELVGDENDGTGRIVQLSLDTPDERTIVQSGLLKPTGIAVIGVTLWIMEQRSLSFAGLAPGAERETVLADLPFNGRSEGSLTVSPDGALIFNTSGRKSGAVVTEGSGAIFRVEDADPIGTGQPVGPATVVATGLKNAYAHTFDVDGQLWATEMSDGSFDGEQAPEELMRVNNGDNFDWPFCIGNRTPVMEFGGTVERCADAAPSHALFAPRATPTAVEVAPWDDNTLLVALWVTDEIAAVPRSSTPDGSLQQATVVASGLGNPQDLLINGDSLLAVDHTGGRILSVKPRS
ncbi:MAG: glucose/arabinose dehydrogenase [Candidatus Poriferisodalaceae bacterium]